MFRFLLILISVMLIAGCRGGGGGGSGSSYSSGYQVSSGSGYLGDYIGGGSNSASIGSGGAAHTPVGSNPEPSTIALFGTGLVGLAYSMLRRKKR